AHDREIVARELRTDEAFERERHALGGGEASLPRHRPAHVEQEDRRAGRRALGRENLEVVRQELERRPGSARERLAERRHQLDLEGIAELVRARPLGPDLRRAAVVALMAAAAVAEETLVDVAQRELADLAHAFRREARAALARREIAGVGE